MLFADDISLLSEEIDQAKKPLSKVQTEAAKIGFHINAKKTEFMAYNHPDISPSKQQVVTSEEYTDHQLPRRLGSQI